ncbi:EamA family transporter RarD [Gracilinema caldarium]|uniref:EamA family transporter RarD n=1 Tax=Gracilinema caldarium TaxID=215591 RepID=UPI0026EEDE4F|nr:EamA family transporter RarD [Gracilinema caldarium]
MIQHDEKSLQRGALFAFAAYGSWGLLPLFWKLLSSVESTQILSCRVVFSLVFVWFILALRGKARWWTLLLNMQNLKALALSALFISLNWGLYIWAVNSAHTVEASLGYYINPLVNVLLGLLFFRERLSPLQWGAVALAASGVLLMTIFSGVFPWISLALALSFGLYGYAKKKIDLTSLEGLASETLLLAPLAIGFLLFRQSHGNGAFSGGSIQITLLVSSGVITALPLLWFARAAKLLPLSTLGFIQFLSPTLQLALGVLVFGEAFPTRNIIAFAFVWAGVLLYSVSYIRRKV